MGGEETSREGGEGERRQRGEGRVQKTEEVKDEEERGGEIHASPQLANLMR